MQQLLLVLQVLLAAGIIALVMLQQGRGADAGASFGGGSSGSLFGSRGPATFLAKATGFLAAVFFVNSLGLAYLAINARTGNSVVDVLSTQQESVLPSQINQGGAGNDDVPTAPGAGTVDSGSAGSETDMPVAPEGTTKTP